MRRFSDRNNAPGKPRLWARLLPWLLTAAILAPLVLPAQPVAAQAPVAAEPVVVAADASGVTIAYDGSSVAAASLAETLPVQRFQGYDLPLHVIPLRFASAEAATLPRITRLEAVDAPPGALAPAAPAVPPVLVDEGEAPPVLAETVALPPAPVFVLRQGWVRGEYVVVVALSPYFQENGVTRLATAVSAIVPGALRIEGLGGDAWAVESADDASLDSAGQDDVMAQNAAANPPVEFASVESMDAVETRALRVRTPGIQQIALSALPAAFQAANASLRLTYRSAPVPFTVQTIGGARTLVFYAPEASDRFNASLVYLLSAGGAAGPTMTTRAITPAPAGAASVALEQGRVERVRNPTNGRLVRFYNSTEAGADGDHYFLGSLRQPKAKATDPNPGIVLSLTDPNVLAPTPPLPLATGPATFVLTVENGNLATTPPTSTPFQLSVGGTGVTTVTRTIEVVNGAVEQHSFTLDGNPAELRIRLTPSATFIGTLLVDHVHYTRPVTLNFSARGGRFTARPGQQTFQWTNLAPAGAPLVLDITDPAQPILLTGAGANGFTDTLAERSYIVAGTDFVHTPAVAAYSPIALGPLPAVDALYILPAENTSAYAAALQPLLTLRASQRCRGAALCKVATVAVQRIYDRYSGGNIDARAIRTFLQEYYAAKSNPRLLSVVLVGDGTWDARNYEAMDQTYMLIPPYMRDGIDLFIGEAACDRCFGQLTGDDPHTGDDPNGRIFSPEVWIGRFPVKSRDELVGVVNKIVAYEKGAGGVGIWRNTIVYLADNYLKKTGAQGLTVDGAGDFARFSDDIRALNPARASQALTPRVYYDPFPQAFPNEDFVPASKSITKPSAAQEPWRVADPAAVRQRAIENLKAGASVVVYNGHSNHFNMGSTEAPDPNDAILKLYDALALNNVNAPYFQLSMTCLTAQFAKPTNAGLTVDESFFLHPTGGAVGVWGSSGLSVVHGHEQLQEGFFALLFDPKVQNPRLGDLMDEGFLEVMFYGTSNEDILRTFLLLGDPLTRLRYRAGTGAWLPLVQNPTR